MKKKLKNFEKKLKNKISRSKFLLILTGLTFNFRTHKIRILYKPIIFRGKTSFALFSSSYLKKSYYFFTTLFENEYYGCLQRDLL